MGGVADVFAHLYLFSRLFLVRIPRTRAQCLTSMPCFRVRGPSILKPYIPLSSFCHKAFYLSINLSIYLAIHLFIHIAILSIYLFIYLSFFLSILSLYLTYLSFYLPIDLSNYLSIYRLSIKYLSVHLVISFYISLASYVYIDTGRQADRERTVVVAPFGRLRYFAKL